jgi:hypothetical protein
MNKAFLILLFSLSSLLLPAQWMQKDHKEIFIGMSAGSGGLYRWGGGSFDVMYRNTTLRVAPGLWYMGVGLNQQIGHYQPKRNNGLILTGNLNYLNDWGLSSINSAEYKRGQHIYQIMPGIRYNLNHLGTLYFEVDGGLNYLHERHKSPNGDVAVSDNFTPMAEVRLGGTFLMRRYRTQQFPLNPKHKYDRIKKRKLKFKQ